MKPIILIVAALSLTFILVFCFSIQDKILLFGENENDPSPNGDPHSQNNKIVSGVGDHREARNERIKKVTVPSPDENLNKVTQASYFVLDRLRDDESRRAKLIKEDKDTEKTTYTFEIAPREDFQEFLDKIHSEIAEQMGINRLALKNLTDEKTIQFDIPSNFVQIVQIRIPFDSKKQISYSSMMTKHGALKGQIDFSKMVVGNVPLESSGWRYEMLIEIDAK